MIFVAERTNDRKSFLSVFLAQMLCFCLSRKSILEMKKDHEEQVRRLKKLKDEEIDAVTSATSQTRLL